jgi:hypothetical protein
MKLDLLAVGRDGADGRVLVFGHEARVPDHVRDQDGGESALGALGSHALLAASSAGSEVRVLLQKLSGPCDSHAQRWEGRRNRPTRPFGVRIRVRTQPHDEHQAKTLPA